MKSRWGRFGLLGPLLALCGVALLFMAAQQRSSAPPSRTTTISIPATGSASAPSEATRVATERSPINDDLVNSAPTENATTSAEAMPVAPGSPPTHLSIPSVGIDQPIVEVPAQVETVSGQQVLVWSVADYAVGHNNTSADPGQPGNIVLAGHDDWHGEVFRNLHSVQQGAEITLTTADDQSHHYIVTDILYRREVGVPLSERLITGELIGPTTDERLTLVTCWPYGVDDHRLIVIAKPAP